MFLDTDHEASRVRRALCLVHPKSRSLSGPLPQQPLAPSVIIHGRSQHCACSHLVKQIVCVRLMTVSHTQRAGSTGLCACYCIFELCSSISETRAVEHSVQFRDPNPGPGMSVLCRLAVVAHERLIAKCPAALCTRTYSVTLVRVLPSQPLSIWTDQVDDSSLKFPET